MDQLRIFIIFILLLLFLALRFFFFYAAQPQYANGQLVAFTTILLSEPQIVGSQQRLSANLGNQKIFIRAPLYPQFHYGDKVKISGILKFRSIDNKKTIMVMYFPKIEIIGNSLAIASFVRQKTISIFKIALPPTYSSLLLGIVFGIKEEMPKGFLENLRISGVMHVIAASGMNVAMVGGFLSSLFGFFLKRQIAILCSIAGILFYAVLAGLEPSIVRASIMGILAFSAQILGRESLSLYGIFLAAFLMLFISPLLLSDIGFQLSFLATIGLLYIRPLFERNKKVKNILNRSVVGEGIATAIAAQAATLPVLLGNFGGYSLWSVVVNGLILWTIPTLMVIGGVGAILGMIVQPLGSTFLYLSLPFLLYFQKVVSMFASFGGVVNFGVLPWQLSLSYYSFLISLVLWLKKKQ